MYYKKSGAGQGGEHLQPREATHETRCQSSKEQYGTNQMYKDGTDKKDDGVLLNDQRKANKRKGRKLTKQGGVGGMQELTAKTRNNERKKHGTYQINNDGTDGTDKSMFQNE